MATYTFIMNFKGGTYISQIKAKDEFEAVLKWGKELDSSQVEGFEEKHREALLERLKDESPVLLTGLTHAWCIGARIGKTFALVNFVKTDV